MLKLRTGGTCAVMLKREAARRMVPSPPNVARRSVFWERRFAVGVEGCEGLRDDVEVDINGVGGMAAKGTEAGRREDRRGRRDESVRREMEG